MMKAQYDAQLFRWYRWTSNQWRRGYTRVISFADDDETPAKNVPCCLSRCLETTISGLSGRRRTRITLARWKIPFLRNTFMHYEAFLAHALEGRTPGREDLALQYVALKCPVSESEQGLALVHTHEHSNRRYLPPSILIACTWFQSANESYRSTIAHPLRLNAAGSRSANWIRGIWSTNVPNHGESALLNRFYVEGRWGEGGKRVRMGNAVRILYPFTADTVRSRGSVHDTIMFFGMSPTDPRAVRGVLAKWDKWSNRAEATQWLLGIKSSRPEGRRSKQRGGGKLGQPKEPKSN
ncbi:hypothetical protein EDC04DRAFT_2604718 [Pisolithus marmoratus]|nr:hypothetical protein EDC04DRAFT_2604718 [Pisolithus marmoratus]